MQHKMNPPQPPNFFLLQNWKCVDPSQSNSSWWSISNRGSGTHPQTTQFVIQQTDLVQPSWQTDGGASHGRHHCRLYYHREEGRQCREWAPAQVGVQACHCHPCSPATEQSSHWTCKSLFPLAPLRDSLWTSNPLSPAVKPPMKKMNNKNAWPTTMMNHQWALSNNKSMRTSYQYIK